MQPFEGIRVLDLTHVLAGPFCTHQLGVLGADVIKIEAPGRPDMMRMEGSVPELNDALYGTYFLAQNAGKRSLTLDLGADEGKTIFRQLIETSDVLVQNYAGDALDRLGFSADASHEINPKLIYCSLTGFGRTGTKGQHGAYDIVVQAFSGVMAANHVDSEGPVRVGPPMVDYGTGAQAAYAIAGALFQRERTGKGQSIDVSMTDCAMMMMSAMVTSTLTTGTPPKPNGNAHPSYAGYRTFPTAGGILMIGAFTNEQLAKLFDALGEQDRAAAVRETPRDRIGESRDSDLELIENRLSNRKASEWETILNDAGVPAARVRTLGESLNEGQIAERNVLGTVEPHPLGPGPTQLPVAGFEYATNGPTLSKAPPRMGEHTEEILRSLGYSAGRIEDLRHAGIV